MKKVLLILGALFIYSSGLYAIAMRGESEKSHYNIVSMSAKIVIECENGEKSFIKKDKDLYYASKRKYFRSFAKAAKYACALKVKKHISKQRTKRIRKNARLRKNAIVCRTQKSIMYLLKDTKHYQSILNGLQSKAVYKNCFIGKANYKVAVTNHYYNKHLIYNYYKMRYGDNNGDNVRYTPIIFLKSIKENKKQKRHSQSKSKSQMSKTKKAVSHKNIRSKMKKKYSVSHKNRLKENRVRNSINSRQLLRHKSPITVESTFVLHKAKPTSLSCVESSKNISILEDENNTKEYSQTVDKIEVEAKTSSPYQENNYEVISDAPSIDEKRDASSAAMSEKADQLNDNAKSYVSDTHIYRCSASSTQTGKIFSGQHLDRDSSKNIALKNCEIEEHNSENCQFEHCFILKLM